MGNPTDARLLRLLAHYENGAAAIRATIAMLAHETPGRQAGNGHGNGTRAALPAVMRDALALEAKRIGGAPSPKPKRKHDGSWIAGRLARRKLTAAALDKFDPKTPKTLKELGIGKATRIGLSSLLRWGYLKPKGNGYIRTARPFRADVRETE